MIKELMMDTSSEYWETCDETLAHINRTNQGKINDWARWTLEVLPYIKGKTVIDYGCGGGDFKEFLNDNDIKIKYIGLDISKRSIKKAKERWPNETIKKVTKKLPDADLLVCFSVIQHMDMEQLAEFQVKIEESGIKRLIVQIRHSEQLTFTGSMIRRCSMPTISFKGYNRIYEGEVLKYGYKYEVHDRI